MTSAEILTAVRRAIGEPTPQFVMDDTITSLINRGTVLIWNIMKMVEPALSIVRKSLNSNTNIFTWPTDALTILNVYDMLGNAASITGASGTSPIVITSAAHGFNDGDIVLVHDVLGNTAANGVWQVTASATNIFSLLGSVYGGTYTAATGKVFREGNIFPRLRKMDMSMAVGVHNRQWYSRGRTIVVDFVGFSNDIIVDYLKASTPILADVPAEYHEGIVSFTVMNLLDQDAAFKSTWAFHQNVWMETLGLIRATLRMSMDASPLPAGISWPDIANIE
jgi:hypothetical protein